MLLSYEDACFYKLLMQAGFVDDVNKWITNIANDNETLEGIYLDLVCCLGKVNEAISCLHNYIKDNIINDKFVCNRLRLFIKKKLDNNEMSIDEASKALYTFSISSEKWNEKYWDDFYYLSVYEDYCLSGLMDKEDYYIIVKDFIEKGNRVNPNDFWTKREKNHKVNKKQRKYKIIWTLVLILYVALIFFLSFLFMKLEKKINGSLSDKTMGIHIICYGFLVVPPIVVSVLGWDWVYSILTRENRNRRREIKRQRKIIDERNKRKSEEIRVKYKLNDKLYTSYEYSLRELRLMFDKFRLILFGICEILCLAMTIGSVVYFDKVSIELGIFIILLGLVVGIYGFCIMLKAYIKGLFYSFTPILCYAIPLVLIYYGFNVKTDWIIGLSTILIGSLLFILFMLFVVVFPMKKYNNALVKYWNILDEKYPDIDDISDYVSLKNILSFYKSDGTHVNIFEHSKNTSSIILKGKVKFEDVILKDVAIKYLKVKDSFDNSVMKAIELLEEYEFTK